MKINTQFSSIEIEGIKNINELGKKINELEGEVLLETKVRIITPLITGGYDTNQDSIIRASEVKATLRWFIRYILFCAVLKEKLKIEDALKFLEDIFGSNDKDSFFDILIQPVNIKKGKVEIEVVQEGKKKRKKVKGIGIYAEDFGHRMKQLENKEILFPKSNFSENDLDFKIIFIKKRKLKELKDKEDRIIQLFKYILHIFGFGRLYRRGFGKIEVEGLVGKDLKVILEEMEQLIKEIFDINIKIGYSEERWNETSKIEVYDLDSGKPTRNLDNFDIIVHKIDENVPTWQECLSRIAFYCKRKTDPHAHIHNTIYCFFLGTPKINDRPEVRANRRGIQIILFGQPVESDQLNIPTEKDVRICRGLYIYDKELPENRNYKIYLEKIKKKDKVTYLIVLDRAKPDKDFKIPSLVIYTIQRNRNGNFTIYSIILTKGKKLGEIEGYLLHIGFNIKIIGKGKPNILNKIYIERNTKGNLLDIIKELLKVGYTL